MKKQEFMMMMQAANEAFANYINSKPALLSIYEMMNEEQRQNFRNRMFEQFAEVIMNK